MKVVCKNNIEEKSSIESQLKAAEERLKDTLSENLQKEQEIRKEK